MSFLRRRLFWVVGVALVALLEAACAAATQAPTPTPVPTVTIYSGREETLVGPIINQFQAATGIQVRVKYASTAALAATLLEEGDKSPADLYFASDPGGLGAVESLLVPLPETLLNQVSSAFRSRQGRWVGISGRARVVVYNTQKLSLADLPSSLLDYADPKWKGRIGWPPTNGSFQAMVTAIRVAKGDEVARRWLQGIMANNPKAYRDNTAVVQAVAAGEVDVGFVNHYYLYRFLQEQGEGFPARNYYLKGGDPGAVVLVAGAGILATSKNKEAAERFLSFMLSPVAQQYFASQTFEYPLVKGVMVHRELVPLENIETPDIDLSRLSDLEGTLKLLREVGVIP